MASAHELGASERVLAESGSVMLCRFAEVIGHHLDPFAAQCRLSSPGGNGRPFTAAEMLDRVAVTGRAVGICVRSIEIPVAQVGTLLGAFDVAMICISPDPLQFAILDRRERERRILWIDRRDHSESTMDIERLRSELKSLGLSTVPCLVYDVTVAEGHGAEAAGHGHHDHHHHADPLKRLFALIRSESSDIWMVLVFALGVGVLTLTTPIAIESLVNTVAFGQLLQPVVVLSLMLFVLLMFAALLRILQTYVVEIIQRRMFVRLAGAVSWRFPRIRQEACDHATLRELANRFLEIATMQKASATLLLDGVAITVGTLVGMAVLAFYHPWLLGFDVVLLVLLAITVFGLGRGGVRTAIAESRSKYAAVNWFEQIASARLAFIDHHGRELAMERGDGITKEYLANRVSHFRVILRQTAFALFLQVASSTVLLGLGGWLVIQGQLTLGQLVAAELIVTIIVGSFAKLGKHLESYYDLMASLDKVGHLVDLPLEEHQGTAALPDGLALSASLSQVEYSYPDSQGPVLHNVSIEIAAGSRVAITGSSASGKSTLLDLLYGLRTPQSGRVELNGYDLRDLRIDSVRDNVALVRSPEVIEGTILENLLIGRTDVPFDELRSVLSDVFLWEAIHGLPDGVTTHLAESGNPLSSQQICRLTVARALLKHPRLLLIDRTLDLLDEAEQDLLWESLNRRREMTIVLVTGRERLARKCEQVIEQALRPASAAAHGGSHGH